MTDRSRATPRSAGSGSDVIDSLLQRHARDRPTLIRMVEALDRFSLRNDKKKRGQTPFETTKRKGRKKGDTKKGTDPKKGTKKRGQTPFLLILLSISLAKVYAYRVRSCVLPDWVSRPSAGATCSTSTPCARSAADRQSAYGNLFGAAVSGAGLAEMLDCTHKGWALGGRFWQEVEVRAQRRAASMEVGRARNNVSSVLDARSLLHPPSRLATIQCTR